MSQPHDTVVPEEEPTNPELPSIEVLLAGLRDPAPVTELDEDGWSSFVYDD